MSHFSRTRSALARTVVTSALVVAAGGLLVACGDDDSSATGEPSTTSAVASTTTKAPSSKTTGDAATPAPSGGGSQATTTDAVEQQQPVPSGFPGPTEVPIDPRGQAFLDGLKKEGITPAGDGQIAVSTADYICAAKEQGSSNEEISTFVTAAVGSEATASGQDITPEQAGKNAGIYIQVAQAEYCR
ncbi:DUF732 domain-containing protein [Rhodococcus hoagii]|nr:DUF732 domain-containing protein [Prescottella equi]MBM4483347.1 DUF732 domain-containing protein [Prescottella equi]MBM4556577.1 DUF732 domain-containing protein [Prescottella equi]NKS86486.1 DUF732 domain-containing protein [Prescottella equi]